MSRILKKNEMLKNQKPCPFCGKNDMIELSVYENSIRPSCKFTAEVTCLNCFGSAHTHGFEWSEKEAEEEVIKAWNRRVK